MEPEFEDVRPRYRLCQAGFGLIALSLALLCAAKVSSLALMFGVREVIALHEHPAWFWFVNAPITWGALLGSYLLWGRWPGTSWQRKAGFLLLLNGLDAVMWTVDHAERFGFEPSGIDLSWTFFLVANAFGWIELVLAGTLAAELAAHLGQDHTQDAGRAAMTLGFIGSMVWGLLALTQTDWGTWPPAPQPTPEFHPLLLISTVLMTILTFQVTALSLATSRLAGRYVRELERREQDIDALRSRSESEGDDISWRD